MNLAVVGTGYVGLVTGACFAEMGNEVICVDNDVKKITMLNNNKIPIWEPALEDMVFRNHQAERLSFTTDIREAVENSLICFIAVGTPPDEDGSTDLSYVLAVARDIALNMNDYKIIVNKSTVPVGTADLVRDEILKILQKRGVNLTFDVVSNPEFLKEGAAVEDFLKPDRVVVGTDKPEVAKIMHELYAPFARTHDKVIIMSIRSAEMTKYAANAMLATKISFMNDIANLCDLLQADVEEVRRGIGSDSRIGYRYIYPGTGYGGSCFPKDVHALIKMAANAGMETRILKAVEAVNEDQKRILIRKVINHFGNDLTGRVFAIWGLSFKPQTDDMREAPSQTVIKGLVKAGAMIQAYDPVAMTEACRVLGDDHNIKYASSDFEALRGADALILITEWHQFRNPDFNKIKKLLKQPVVFDGRNLYNPGEMKEAGITYYAIGRQ